MYDSLPQYSSRWMNNSPCKGHPSIAIRRAVARCKGWTLGAANNVFVLSRIFLMDIINMHVTHIDNPHITTLIDKKDEHLTCVLFLICACDIIMLLTIRCLLPRYRIYDGHYQSHLLLHNTETHYSFRRISACLWIE